MKHIKTIIQWFVDLWGILSIGLLSLAISAESIPRLIVVLFQNIATFIVVSFDKATTVTKKALAVLAAILLLGCTIFGFTYLVTCIGLAIASPFKLVLFTIGAFVIKKLFDINIKVSKENGGTAEVTVDGK